MASNKTIMIVSSNSKHAERLKSELEERKVCDRIDIHTANPQKLLEALILDEESDYRMFVIDDAVKGDQYELADNLKHNFPAAHLVLLSLGGKPPGTIDTIRSNRFYQAHRGEGFEKRFYSKLREKPDRELTEHEKEEKKEYEYACRLERLGFDVNYIRKPIKSYAVAATKIQQILVAGVYKRGVKYYPSVQEEKKARSKKAFEKIMAIDSCASYASPAFRRLTASRLVSANDFKRRLEWDGKDIWEKEHAAEIVKRLRSYEDDAKRQVAEIQKIIAEWEDRFPGLAQDPSAFEVETRVAEETGEKKTK